MALLGIDISHHQGSINITSLDVDFVIMKATEGVGYRDPNVDTYYSQARQSGVNRQNVGLMRACR
ncbi:GH25 family lysozyme [Trueperella pyogenes]|uniref:GH25 family lysozyme n=1 Tax=Trueperella pyogenes TaxID=1661 RepID=UPI00345DA560